MNKPLKWLQREERSASIRWVDADMLFDCRCWSQKYKPVSIISAKSDSGVFEINTHRKRSSLDVDVLHASSLCCLHSPSTHSAQTCFCLPPLNSLLSERDQRSGTLTCPEGGWRTPHLPPLHERCAVPPISLFCIHLSLLSSPGSPDNVQKELQYLVSGWINRCPATSCVESLCVKMKEKKTQVLKRDSQTNWKMT